MSKVGAEKIGLASLPVEGSPCIFRRMKVPLIFGLIALLSANGVLAAHPVGQPDFAFVCKLGGKSVRLRTEGQALVYRYGRISAPELTIRGSTSGNNLFFRHDAVGTRGEGQQLRFVNGEYSYALSSLFIAGAGGTDEVRFYVLHGSKVIKTQLCQTASSFENYDQLDALPRDSFRSLAY